VARTHTHLNLGEQLKPMSELPDYKVEPGDPDPRGWTVRTPDGRVAGRVEDLVVDLSAMKVRHLIVMPAGSSASAEGRSILLNTSDVDIRKDSREVIARSFPEGEAIADERQATTSGMADRTADTAARRGTERVLTRSEEELNIGKREVERGEARIGKRVETEHVSEPITRRHEEVVVERRPVEAGARADASIGNDEIRVPLMEEEVVVEKRAVVKEELVVGKRIVEERDTVEAEVRREEIDIENPKPGTSPRDPRRDER
jgi:uncharacterized protein (TIGR02271 family)